jgi:hypothetical protein
VPSQVREGLPADQFLAAVRGNPLQFSDLASYPRTLLLKDRCHPFILQVLRDPYLQVTADDVESSGPSDGTDHLHP